MSRLTFDMEQVHIHTVSAKTKRLFERLRDPVPASRVRRLIVCPHITLSPPPAGPVSLLWNRIFSTVSRTARTPPIERLVDALMLIFPNLVNLRSFEVEAWDMAPGYDLRGFFRSAWAAFGPKLEAVSIGGRPENFRQFVESEPDIASCTCLNLQFTHEHEMDAHAAVVGILTDCVAPYITHLAPQLEILKIWSWSTLDLSALFPPPRTIPPIARILR
ncbi:hypothetical protein C8F01DRAFT_656362 [Mycena amicta]|nr:hypothetical protein C8F01DRAFT_656362 [Mycena amicta]